jgi:hypothetical protein
MEAMLVAFLAPVLPYLLGKVEGAADKAVDAFGDEAWKRVRAVWIKLRPKVEEKEGAREAAEALGRDPEDETARGALQFQLRTLLRADPEMAAEIEQLLQEGQRAGVINNEGVIVYGGVHADRGGVAAGGNIYGGAGGIHTGGSSEPEHGEQEQ